MLKLMQNLRETRFAGIFEMLACRRHQRCLWNCGTTAGSAGSSQLRLHQSPAVQKGGRLSLRGDRRRVSSNFVCSARVGKWHS